MRLSSLRKSSRPHLLNLRVGGGRICRFQIRCFLPLPSSVSRKAEHTIRNKASDLFKCLHAGSHHAPGDLSLRLLAVDACNHPRCHQRTSCNASAFGLKQLSRETGFSHPPPITSCSAPGVQRAVHRWKPLYRATGTSNVAISLFIPRQWPNICPSKRFTNTKMKRTPSF